MSHARMDLPAGLSAAPYTAADLDAVFAVAAAQQQHDIGRVEIEAADIEADWQRPSFDFAAQTMGVFDGDRLVAYAEVSAPNRGDAAVLPDYRGRGIGTRSRAGCRTPRRTRGSTGIGMPVPEG